MVLVLVVKVRLEVVMVVAVGKHYPRFSKHAKMADADICAFLIASESMFV